jgi:short-subunit dehydrogenase
MAEFKGKRYVVTGAASGIGHASDESERRYHQVSRNRIVRGHSTNGV